MALHPFQLCVVFAIGLAIGPASHRARAFETSELEKESALSLRLQDPQDVTVGRGQSATLRCRYTSTVGGATVTWYRNNSTVPKDDPRWVQHADGTLVVPKVVPGRKGNGVAGDYCCLVANGAGALLSSTAKLRVATIDKDLGCSPEHQNTSESQPALFFCDLHSVPPALIRWEKNEQTLPHDPRFVPLSDGTLLITKTLTTDTGSYRCVAENQLLRKTRYSKNATLTVFLPESQSNTVPRFLPLRISPNRTVSTGEKVTMYCLVTGHPVPNVQWINHDGIVISNSTRLEITNTTIKDSGNYTCMAYNSEGHILQHYELVVEEKPHFNVTPTSKKALLAKTLRLECQAMGVPSPTIYWLKDGKPLHLGNVSRVKKSPIGIVFSYTYLHDSGIYQCVAVNSAGRIWSAAQVEIVALRPVPPPPQHVRCRPFNESSICLTWQSPPGVTAQAYTLYPFYTSNGYEVALREYLTNNTHQLVMGLSKNINYTFHVRLYNAGASNESDKVTCMVGDANDRDLDLEAVEGGSVALEWTELSSDTPCIETRSSYLVQWRKDQLSNPNIARTSQRKHVVSDLIPGTDYQFRVVSESYPNEKSSWVLFSVPESENATTDHNVVDKNAILPPPMDFAVVSTAVDAVNLTWNAIPHAKYYTVCYVALVTGKKCVDGLILKSFPVKLHLKKLEPNTMYEFRVRSHNFNGVPGDYSQPFHIRTLVDVPSPIVDLKYKIVNSTTVCLYWSPPKNRNGKLLNYTVTYTPDRNWSLEKWPSFTVPATNTKKSTPKCHLAFDNVVSVFLTGLRVEKQYIVTVRAGNEAGLGRPGILQNVTTDITVKKYHDDGEEEEKEEEEQDIADAQSDVLYNQKIGVIIGVILALICVFFCVLCILLRKRCLKRRALNRATLAASNNYYPAVAHYTSNLGAVQMRLEDPCAAEVHEIERLMCRQDGPAHIPQIAPTHLDTKGVDGFPNGSSKPYANGNASNGQVHITENPQYIYGNSNNGVVDKKSKKHEGFEQDPNFNVKSSKFYDVYRVLEKKFNNNRQDVDDVDDIDEHDVSNVTDVTLTCLDDSIDQHRRATNVLGPNG